MHGSVLADTLPERHAAGCAMSEIRAGFARTGNLGVAGQPDWSAYILGHRPTMILDAACGVEEDPGGEERRFWQVRSKG